jgi:transcriptional regulator with XRE-family HTH domain
MNVLDRIVELRTAKGWSEYQLAEESGMTQSTISSWYRRHMMPSVPSLERICDAFDISLSQFFMESGSQPIVLTDKQVELINATNKLSPEQLDNLLIFLNSLNAKKQ